MTERIYEKEMIQLSVLGSVTNFQNFEVTSLFSVNDADAIKEIHIATLSSGE